MIAYDTSDYETDDASDEPYSILSANRRDILWAVAATEPATGQAVKRFLDRAGREVTNGALYPTLDDLAETGHISKGPQEFSARANSYSLTERGRRAISRRRAFEHRCLTEGGR